MDDYQGFESKIIRTLFLSQSVVSAAVIATGTVNSIAGADLSGMVAWAGLPMAVLLLSGALGSLTWGFLMERIGRRKGLVIGLMLGAGGGVLAGSALWLETFSLFLAGMALFGFGQAAMMLARFAAAEVHPLEKRGRAMATVVLGGTIGAVAGPLLVGPTGLLASRFGFHELVGPYGASILLFTIAAAIVLIWLRPDPSEIARQRSLQEQQSQEKVEVIRSFRKILSQPGVRIAILSMVMGQAVMIMVMVITSLHMRALGHPLLNIAIVISAHTFGMYAFSIITGRLVDRMGREPVIMLGAFILILAGMSAGLSIYVAPLAVSLLLLGLGWNLCFVGGSVLLTDQLTHAEQSRMQGFNDLLVGLASAAGSLGSGFVFAVVGYQTMGFIGAVLALIPFAGALWWSRNTLRLAPA